VLTGIAFSAAQACDVLEHLDFYGLFGFIIFDAMGLAMSVSTLWSRWLIEDRRAQGKAQCESVGERVDGAEALNAIFVPVLKRSTVEQEDL
jgi:hypothetical protein